MSALKKLKEAKEKARQELEGKSNATSWTAPSLWLLADAILELEEKIKRTDVFL